MSLLTTLEYLILREIPPEGIFLGELKSAVARNTGREITTEDVDALVDPPRVLALYFCCRPIAPEFVDKLLYVKISLLGIAAREAMATEMVKKNTDA